ncbi:MAG: right-handed parallel beta-helix repeat-containing protein [Candidatus Kariarchaeaceae archaeon]
MSAIDPEVGGVKVKQKRIYLIILSIILGSITLNEIIQWNKYRSLSTNQETLSDLAREIAREEIEEFIKYFEYPQIPNTSYPYLLVTNNGAFYQVFSERNHKLIYNHTEASSAIEWAWANLTEGGRFYTYGPGETWILNDDINSQNEAVTWVSDRSLLFQAGAALDTSIIRVTHNYTSLYGIKLDANKHAQSPGADMSGIYYVRASHGIIKDCEVFNAKRTTRTRGEGIELGQDSDYNIIEGNYCWENDYDGIKVKGGDYNTITGNTLFSNGASGIQIATGTGNTVVSNTINGDRQFGPTAGWTRGIVLHGAQMSSVSDNTIHGVSRGLMIVEDCVGNIISDNVVEDCEYGFWAFITQNLVNVIDNNIFFNLDVYGIRIESAGLVDSRITNNYINDAQIGISIAHPSASNNVVKGNTFRSVVTQIEDLGRDTQFETIMVPFVTGSQHLSEEEDPHGWKISAPGEFASTCIALPLNLEKIVSIQVWAVTQSDTENMVLEFKVIAGKTGEQSVTEQISISGHPVDTNGLAESDVIFWEYNPADNIHIGDLSGGDSLEITVVFDSSGSSGSSTNAIFRSIIIEYV